MVMKIDIYDIYRYICDRMSPAGRRVMVSWNVNVHSVCQKGKAQSPLQNLALLIKFKAISGSVIQQLENLKACGKWI